MSVGPMGIIGSAAGSPIAQTAGSEIERARQDAGDQQRRVTSDQKAESAAGIGETEEDQHAGDRDADGRRLWERNAQSDSGDGSGSDDASGTPVRQSKDATGKSGTKLDLNGKGGAPRSCVDR